MAQICALIYDMSSGAQVTEHTFSKALLGKKNKRKIKKNLFPTLGKRKSSQDSDMRRPTSQNDENTSQETSH